MHPCTGPGCSVCAASMAGEESTAWAARAFAWKCLAQARGAILKGRLDGRRYYAALDAEKAAEAALRSLGIDPDGEP